MSGIKKLAKNAGAEVTNSFTPVLQKNANLFTFFAIAVIIVAGLGMVNGKTTWWLSAGAVLIIALIVFVFFNARVLVKAAIASLVALFTANFALSGGVFLSPESSVGLVWMTAQLFFFFAVVGVSYLTTGSRSRWTGASYALIFNLIMTSAFIESMNSNLAIGLGMACGLALFMGYYRAGIWKAGRSSSAPANEISTSIDEALALHAEREGWEIRKMHKVNRIRKTDTIDYLVWNGQHAYVLHPVRLESKFSISPSRKSTKLVHRGMSINPWLLWLINKRIPLWRARNANIMLVLLDVSNMNGTTPETIGVSLPDTPKKLPVGIFPAKNMLAQRKKIGVLSAIDRKYGVYLRDLTEKQKQAMSEIGMDDSSAYMEDAPIEDLDETAEDSTASK